MSPRQLYVSANICFANHMFHRFTKQPTSHNPQLQSVFTKHKTLTFLTNFHRVSTIFQQTYVFPTICFVLSTTTNQPVSLPNKNRSPPTLYWPSSRPQHRGRLAHVRGTTLGNKPSQDVLHSPLYYLSNIHSSRSWLSPQPETPQERAQTTRASSLLSHIIIFILYNNKPLRA